MWGIIAVVSVVLIGVAAYYITRFMKGSIKLSVDRSTYTSGDPITGSFLLETKKSLEGTLTVSLIGTKVSTYYDHENRRKTRRDEFFRDRVVIERRRKFKAGNKRFKFEVPSPQMQEPGFMDSKIGRLITGILNSGRNSRMEWKVEARLDMKGVDLAASKRVNLTM